MLLVDAPILGLGRCARAEVVKLNPAAAFSKVMKEHHFVCAPEPGPDGLRGAPARTEQLLSIYVSG